MNLILVLISVILTIIVLNFHFRGPKKQRVPRWMRKYIIGYLGRVFCFCHESRAYLHSTSSSTSRSSKQQVPDELIFGSTKASMKKEKKPANGRLDEDGNERAKLSSSRLSTAKCSKSRCEEYGADGDADEDDEMTDYLDSNNEPAYVRSSHHRVQSRQNLAAPSSSRAPFHNDPQSSTTSATLQGYLPNAYFLANNPSARLSAV